jgi:WD40 repeat protein
MQPHFLSLLPLLGALAGAAPPSLPSPSHGEVTALAYTPDGRALLSAAQDGYIRALDPETGTQRREVLAHKGGVFGLALARDGKRFASAGADGVVRLWDRETFAELKAFSGHTGRVVGVALSPDGKWVASCGYDRSVRIWDPRSGKLRHNLKGSEHRATGVAFAPDGKTLASGGIVPVEFPGVSGPTVGERVRLWDVETGVLRNTLNLRGDRVVFSPEGRILAAAGLYMDRAPKPRGLLIGGVPIDAGTRAGLLDWPSGTQRLTLNEYFTALAFSPDGKFLATGWGSRLHYGGIFLMASPAKGIHLWEVATGEEVLHLEVPRSDATVLAFAPDGRRLATGTGKGLPALRSLAPSGWTAPKNLGAAAQEKAWAALRERAAAPAYRAVWDLAAAGDETAAFLARRLKAVPSVPPARLQQLLEALDSEEFAERQKAQQELARLSDGLEGDLEAVLEARPSAEVRRQVLALLTEVRRRPASGEGLRTGRALLILERIGTPAARAALQALARGAPGARLTRDARAALARLEWRAR